MSETKAKTTQIWNRALEILKTKLPKSTYDAWVLNLVPNEIEGNEFSIRCGQKIAIQMMEPHNSVFTEVLSEIIGRNIAFKIVYDDELSKMLAKKSQASSMLILRTSFIDFPLYVTSRVSLLKRFPPQTSH